MSKYRQSAHTELSFGYISLQCAYKYLTSQSIIYETEETNPSSQIPSEPYLAFGKRKKRTKFTIWKVYFDFLFRYFFRLSLFAIRDYSLSCEFFFFSPFRAAIEIRALFSPLYLSSCHMEWIPGIFFRVAI